MQIDCLRSMLHSAIDIKSGTHGKTAAGLIEFCITVPVDRFMEIRKLERDEYIYRWKHSDILWTGIELSILCRKRLELLTDYMTGRELPPLERLDDILEQQYPGHPQSTKLYFQRPASKDKLVFLPPQAHVLASEGYAVLSRKNYYDLRLNARSKEGVECGASKENCSLYYV